MSPDPERTDAPPAIDPRLSAGGGVGVDAPVTLIDLVDGRSRRLLGQAAKDLGVGIHVIAAHGQPLVGNELDLALLAPAGLDFVGVDDPATGRRYQVQALLHEGDVIGWLAVGPYPAERESGVRRVSVHLGHLVDQLLATGLEKVYASRMHSASMEDAYAELQQKNAKLAQAVERLQELDKIKSNFLATVSHELRTPLTSVIGYSEMLLEGIAGELNGEQREYVQTVMEKGEQLLELITSILDISKIEAGKVNLGITVFPASEVVQATLTTVVPSARRKNITLAAELAEGLPPLRADRDKVRQVLVNLVGNAVKFTPEGGSVTVRAYERPLSGSATSGQAALAPLPMGAEAKRGLCLEIADTGIGIPLEAQAKVFEPFFQVDNSSTRSFGGTGLGLSIVRSFVEAHGGTVWVESTPGKGTTFYFTLPIAQPGES